MDEFTLTWDTVRSSSTLSKVTVVFCSFYIICFSAFVLLDIVLMQVWKKHLIQTFFVVAFVCLNLNITKHFLFFI